MNWIEELSEITEVFEPSESYMYDETPPKIAPKPAKNFVVVKPSTSTEVSEILRFASKRKIPIFTRGGGTGLSGGAVPTSEGIVLSTERMSKIEVDRENRVAVCGAGVTLGQLDNTAEKSGLSFPPHPGAETATVGGMIATNAGGVRALKYGTMRNYVLGLEVVLADGRVLRLGGKTLKNSTGYSLLHLFVGSEGTLGVITQATIRLFPSMGDMVVMGIPFQSMDDALRCVIRISNEMLPLAAEFMEKRAVEIGEAVSGKRWVSRDGNAHLLLIFERFDEAEKAAEIAMQCNALDIFLATSRREQRDLLEVRGLIYEGLRDKIIEILDVCVPPASIAEYVERSNDIAVKYGVELITYGHAGDGNVHQHPLIYDGWEKTYFSFRKELLRLAVSLGGVISGEHGIGTVKREELRELLPEQYELMLSVKKVFDPNSILNPGKVV